MKSFNQTRIVSIISSLSVALVLSSTNVYSADKIGYGSSTAVVTAKIQESFFMGFELGLIQKLGEKRATEVLLVKQIADGFPRGAVRSAEHLLKNGAVAFVGYPSSHDSLLVADIAKQNGMLAIFTGSGHSDLAKKGATVFTTGASMTSAVDAILDFVHEKYPGKRGAAIINPYAVFSMDHEPVIQNLISSGKFKDTKIEAIRLNKELILKDDDLQRFKKGEFDFIFLTPYPEELVPFMNQLTEAHIDLPMVAGSSWGTAEPDIMRRFLTSSKSPLFMGTEWIKGSADSQAFEKSVRARYGKSSNSEMSFGYDVGMIIGTVVSRVKGLLTKESILQAFNLDRCFRDLTIGNMCFNASGGHAIRKIVIEQFTKKGFIPVKRVTKKGGTL